MTTATAETFYSNLREWSRSLSFYCDQVRIFNQRLVHIVNRNTGKEVLAQAEHFQNQFILQKEQFDLLLHDINEQKSRLSSNFLPSTGVVYLPVEDIQASLKEKFETAAKIFTQTKNEFYRFLANIL